MFITFAYLTLTSQQSGCGGSAGGSGGCSDNSSTFGYFYFTIGFDTYGGCPTPCSNGRLYLDQVELQNWTVSGNMNSTSGFCKSFNQTNLSGPMLFYTKRPDQGNYYSCVLTNKRNGCSNGTLTMQGVRSNSPISDWAGSHTTYGAIHMAEMYVVL